MKTKAKTREKKQEKFNPFEQAFQTLPKTQQEEVEEKAKKKVVAECRKIAKEIIEQKTIFVVSVLHRQGVYK